MKKHMMRKASMDIINWLNCIWITDLPPNSKYLACYLRKFMNSNHDMAWPSYARIIEETGLSRATVAKYLKILEQEGWINRDSGNSTTNTIYFATLPDFINDEVKNFDDNIQKKLKGSSPAKLRSSSDKLGVVRQLNTNKQSNTQSNNKTIDTQTSLNDVFFVDQLSKEDFEYCHEAMGVLSYYKDKGHNIYTGSMSISDWQDCENQMRSVDFDSAMYLKEIEPRFKSIKKKSGASLKDLLFVETKLIDFEQFYSKIGD